MGVRPVVAVFAAAVVTVAAACGTHTFVARKPAVRVLAKSGCPKTIAGYHDVTNLNNTRGSTLLPASTPTGVLLCGYGSEFEGSRFKSSRTLTVAQAISLAAVINRIRLGPDTTSHSCPPDTGLVTIFAFTYQGEPDVDLWWHADGCEGLDNGFRIGVETANPSFYNGFMGEMQRLHR